MSFRGANAVCDVGIPRTEAAVREDMFYSSLWDCHGPQSEPRNDSSNYTFLTIQPPVYTEG